jgi:D-proline reductase (dithiol) PrdB
VGLAARRLEWAGISTVALQLLHAAVAEVRPPRSLWVPFRDGYALGAPDDLDYCRAVLAAAFEMLEDAGLTAPALRDYSPQG